MPIKKSSIKDVRKTKTRTAYNTEHTAKTKLAWIWLASPIMPPRKSSTP